MKPIELASMLHQQPINLSFARMAIDPKDTHLFDGICDRVLQESLDDPQEIKKIARELGVVSEIVEQDNIRDLQESKRHRASKQNKEELRISEIATTILSQLETHLRLLVGQPKSWKIGDEPQPVSDSLPIPPITPKRIIQFLNLNREELLHPHLSSLSIQTRLKIVRMLAMTCSEQALVLWCSDHDQEFDDDFEDEVLEEMCLMFRERLAWKSLEE